MARIRQIRDVIFVRQKENQTTRLRVEEIKMRNLLGAIHGAAGNRRGANQARRFALLPREKRTPTAAEIQRRFPVDEAVGGLITPEQVRARQIELGLVVA